MKATSRKVKYESVLPAFVTFKQSMNKVEHWKGIFEGSDLLLQTIFFFKAAIIKQQFLIPLPEKVSCITPMLT